MLVEGDYIHVEAWGSEAMEWRSMRIGRARSDGSGPILQDSILAYHSHLSASTSNKDAATSLGRSGQVDLRGLHLPFGTMAVAINGEPSEVRGAAEPWR